MPHLQGHRFGAAVGFYVQRRGEVSEKDHYKYGIERKIDPRIPMLRARVRELEEALKIMIDQAGVVPDFVERVMNEN